MKVWKSYFAGLGEATIRPKMILLLWIINLLFSSVIFYLVLDMCTGVLGSTLAAESLVQKMDYHILFDTLFHHGGQTSMIFAAALILIVLYIPVSLLLKGGILNTLRVKQTHEGENPQKFLPLFFQGAGKFFGRFFRLWIYSLILWLVFLLLNVVLNPLGKLLTNDGFNEHMLVYVIIGRIIIGLFLVLLIKMIMDYSRIRIIVEDTPKVFRSFVRTLRYVFGNLGKTLALFYLLFFTGILIMILFWILKSSVPSTSVGGSVLGFWIGQIIIYFRSWSNVTFQAGQLRFYVENE